MNENRTIYLLIGPKGSGKSFIGKLMDEELGIRFIRVEDWAKSVKKERSVDDESYVREVFAMIEDGVRQVLKEFPQVVFESTGLSDAFDAMLERLCRDFRVVTIRVKAGDALCLERVKTRDQAIHVNVSDDQVNVINRNVAERNLPTDFTLENDNCSAEELVRQLKMIVER
jgi:predicted kinase